MDDATAGKINFWKRINNIKSNESSDLRLQEMDLFFNRCMLKIYQSMIILSYQHNIEANKTKSSNQRTCKILMQKLGISDISSNGITEVSGDNYREACIFIHQSI